jgi:hypothetical protein
LVGGWFAGDRTRRAGGLGREGCPPVALFSVRQDDRAVYGFNISSLKDEFDSGFAGNQREVVGVFFHFRFWLGVASCNWEEINLAFGFRKKKVTIPEKIFGGRKSR